MFVQPFSFVSYYFLELNLMILVFISRRHNNRLRGRYRDDPSTYRDFDPDLWMEAGSSGGPDWNCVYGLSNTIAENLRTTRSILNVRSSQSVSNTQSQEFAALQEHTAHLTEKYEQLSVNYEELCRLVMDMRSQMGGTCAPSFGYLVPGTTNLLSSSSSATIVLI